MDENDLQRHKKMFTDDGICYLEYDDGCMGVYIFQTLSNYTHKNVFTISMIPQ